MLYSVHLSRCRKTERHRYLPQAVLNADKSLLQHQRYVYQVIYLARLLDTAFRRSSSVASRSGVSNITATVTRRVLPQAASICHPSCVVNHTWFVTRPIGSKVCAATQRLQTMQTFCTHRVKDPHALEQLQGANISRNHYQHPRCTCNSQ